MTEEVRTFSVLVLVVDIGSVFGAEMKPCLKHSTTAPLCTHLSPGIVVQHLEFTALAVRTLNAICAAYNSLLRLVHNILSRCLNCVSCLICCVFIILQNSIVPSWSTFFIFLDDCICCLFALLYWPKTNNCVLWVFLFFHYLPFYA